LNLYHKKSHIPSPKNLLEYSLDVGELVEKTFNYQLAMFKDIKCKSESKIGKIHFCQPIDEKLSKYNIIDFNKGSELIDIGKNSIQCSIIDFCSTF
jgi:hypothetical protein